MFSLLARLWASNFENIPMIELHVTYADEETAAKLAEQAIGSRLAACANLITGIRSLYRWQGNMVDEGEVLVIYKTAKPRAPDLEAFLKEKHPYETPAIIRHEQVSANHDYDEWITEETAP